MNKATHVMKYLLTGAVVLVAAALAAWKYWDYITNPWTRDGQVHAQVIQVTPRVSGPIIHLPIQDNRMVKAGDLLFEIDPRTFQSAVKQAEADQRIYVQAQEAEAVSGENRAKAEEEFKNVLIRYPTGNKVPAATYKLGLVYLAQNRGDAARRQFEAVDQIVQDRLQRRVAQVIFTVVHDQQRVAPPAPESRRGAARTGSPRNGSRRWFP